jgi:polyhydroxybutyrate depolymerase
MRTLKNLRNLGNLRNLRVVLFSLLIIGLCSGCARQRSVHENTDHSNSLTVDGLTRTYILHVPPSYDKTYPTPLVLALHGGGGSPEKMRTLTDFNTVSDREGFMVVYPAGVENHWNDGRALQDYKAHRENINDVKFMSVLIDHLSNEYNIDETRIYAAGISNGAMMSCRLACELSEKIAAVAMVAGAMPEELSFCSPPDFISVLVISGTDDPLVPWEGGEIQVGDLYLGKTMSVYDTVMHWVSHNACVTHMVTWLPDTHDDNTRVRKEVYGQGSQGTEVVLYAVEGGGHTWPGGPQYASERLIGRTSYDISAAEVIWQFFTGHTLLSLDKKGTVYIPVMSGHIFM